MSDSGKHNQKSYTVQFLMVKEFSVVADSEELALTEAKNLQDANDLHSVVAHCVSDPDDTEMLILEASDIQVISGIIVQYFDFEE